MDIQYRLCSIVVNIQHRIIFNDASIQYRILSYTSEALKYGFQWGSHIVHVQLEKPVSVLLDPWHVKIRISTPWHVRIRISTPCHVHSLLRS